MGDARWVRLGNRVRALDKYLPFVAQLLKLLHGTVSRAENPGLVAHEERAGLGIFGERLEGEGHAEVVVSVITNYLPDFTLAVGCSGKR